MGGDDFGCDLYFAAPLRKQNKWPSMVRLQALYEELNKIMEDPSLPSFLRFKLRALSGSVCTRWEDCEPRHLVHDVLWYVAVEVDAKTSKRYGFRTLMSQVNPLEVAGLFSLFKVWLNKASASFASEVDVEASTLIAAADLTNRFEFYEEDSEEEEEEDSDEEEEATAVVEGDDSKSSTTPGSLPKSMSTSTKLDAAAEHLIRRKIFR
jgi:hypothetical protein